MQIRLDNYEKCYPARLKRFFQSNINYKTYDEFIPHMKRAVVGNLPPELIKFFPKENRGCYIKEFQNALADISEYLRISYNKSGNRINTAFSNFPERQSGELKTYNKRISEEFNRILKEINLPQKITSELNYVDYGGFSSIYKLSLFDKDGKKLMHDKALKIYYNIKNSANRGMNGHNNYAEANMWTFIKHHAGHQLDKTQFTKHYISDMQSGYSLTEFLDADIHKTSSKFNFFDILQIIYTDKMTNPPIKGKIYDIGGFHKLPGFTGDKVVIRYLKKLFYRNSEKDMKPVLESLEHEAKNPKNEHRGKIQTAISLFGQSSNLLKQH